LKVPILFDLNWTGTSGYLQNFAMAMVLASLGFTSFTLALSKHCRSLNVDWCAVFLEACKDKSPTDAGIGLFGLLYGISIVALVTSLTVKKTGKYVVPLYIGWALMISGPGLLTTLRADSSMAKSIGFQLVIGGGIGTIYTGSLFPILAPIPVTQTAPAMALSAFSQNFGYVSSPSCRVLPSDK
jgi:hypothetical protein